MKKLLQISTALAVFVQISNGINAAIPTQDDYYKVEPISIDEGVVLEASGIAMLPNGNLAVSSRRGDIYTFSNPLGELSQVKMKLFAAGLHEPLGIHWDNGWLYATQRCEMTRIKDEDGDGRADVFETVNDGWGITGDYHEYAFGTKPDAEGNMWVVL